MKKKLTIAILKGGISAEREISLQTGKAVENACKSLGYRVLSFDAKSDLEKLLQAKKQIDVVFPALHGRGGEDGMMQAFLTLFGFKFVGSAMEGMTDSFNKIRAKEIYREAKLPIAKDVVITKGEKNIEAKVTEKVGFPCFVKPAVEGSSFGASLVRKKSELAQALKLALRFGEKVLVEEFIEGMEVSCGVLEKLDKKLIALPIVEICPKQKFFDLKSKYDAKLCEEIIPARVSKTLENKIKNIAIKAHQALGLKHLSRSDMLIRKNKIYLLETNTLPGFTANSLYPKEAREFGMEFPELVQHLIALALR